jgi:hypothetical protein
VRKNEKHIFEKPDDKNKEKSKTPVDAAGFGTKQKPGWKNKSGAGK